MSEQVPKIIYLITRDDGTLGYIAFSEEEANDHASAPESSAVGEVCEWPIKPLRILSGGAYEYATEHIATETADLGKLTSIDTLLEIALAVRGRDGWKCVNVLPGLFGERCYPPGVTVVWRREIGNYMAWCEASLKEPRERFHARLEDITTYRDGETA